MFVVDRIVAVLRPTEKMLHWVKTLPNAPDMVTIKNLQTDCTALLLPSFETPKQAEMYIKQIHEGILESELISWGILKNHWPPVLDYALFKSWFNVEYHSVIFDTAFIEAQKNPDFVL
jgi:hypothetical protein